MSRLPLYLLIIILFAVSVTSVYAQAMILPDRVPGDTVVTTFVPVAAYASDLGLIGGVVVNRYRYHPLSTPFVSLAELNLQASTKGMLYTRLRYEHTELFGRPIRSRWTLYGERHPSENYFGLGNHTTFDTDAWHDEYYFFELKRFGLEWLGRKTVYQSDRWGGQIDLIAAAVTGYEVPDDDHERLMGHDRPTGVDGGWVNAAGIGILWENRDSEFASTRGNRFELTGEWAPGSILGDFAMASIFSEYRHFVTLPIPYFRPVVAARLAGKWATGNIPYWKRPYLGDELTLRGYPVNRFRGDASVFYNVELRTWILEYSFLDFKLGIHGFHDAGRVFYDGDGLDRLFRDYHRTYGGGIATALFTPDFIIRMDVGFSDEMYRLYMNFGYMF